MKLADLSVWEAFYWVAKLGNFSLAAKELRVGVPLLSKRVAHLEEELGIRLFNRSTRKVGLTDEGRGLLPKVETLLEDFRGLESQFENPDKITGTIRMSCMPALADTLLAPALMKFSKLHPDVRFEMGLSDHLVDLLESNLDLAIRVQKPVDSRLIFKSLAPNDFVLCASPSYLKENGTPLKPKDLFSHRLFVHQSYERLGFVDGSYKIKDFGDARKIVCDSGSFLTRMALIGAGISVRSIWDARPHFETGDLLQVLKKFPIERLGDIYAVIPSRRLLAARIRVFLDFLSVESKKW